MIQSSSLSTNDKALMLSAVEAVPEPTALAFCCVIGLLALGRRGTRPARDA